MGKDKIHTPILLTLIILIISWGALSQPAHAVWHVLLNEHFAGTYDEWYPTNGWGNWSCNPPFPIPYSWGVQDYIYKFNGIDGHSIWCVGMPNTLDPEFDDYVPNTNSWAKWGPIDLSNASAARASFWYFCRTQAFSDYIRWGAYPANQFNMYEANRNSGYVLDWNYGYVDFDSLQEGTISLLGQSNVYLEFHFFSNGDQQVDLGAFIDEVNIAWDDGFFDFEALNASLADPDSTTIFEAVIGESVIFSLYWKAYGTGVTPMFDITCDFDGASFYTERRNIDIGNNQQVWVSTYSTPWVVTAGTHTVTWMLDASREIEEANENNNDTLLTFVSLAPNVPPWIQFLHPTWGDTANQEFLITWEDEDPDDNAIISLYWDDDSTGFDGQSIPGATYIEEDDTTDSFNWNLAGMAEGEVWVFAYMTDNEAEFWQYSEGPFIIDHNWVGFNSQHNLQNVADYILESIYPNPFNNSTKIRIGLPLSEMVTLRIFDSMGRLVAEPFRGMLSAGYHEIAWSPGALPSGLYLVELASPEVQKRAKVLYLK